MDELPARPLRERIAGLSRSPGWRDGICALFLVGLVALFMWRVTILGNVLMPLDVLFAHEPWRSEATDKPTGALWNPLITDGLWEYYPSLDYAHEVWHGKVPLWDPLAANGVPALGRGEMFSNPAYELLKLFMATGHALSYGAALHLALGAVFAFLLVKEFGSGRRGALVGALVFAFNGYSIGWLAQPFLLPALMWLPLVFWGVERALRRGDWRWGLGGSLGFALQILSGNVLLAFFSAVTLGLHVAFHCLTAWRAQKGWRDVIRPLVVGAIAVGGGAALAAPQFLLTLELFFQTTRTAKIGASSFMPASKLIRLLAPAYDGNQLHGNTYAGLHNYSETDLYFGIAPLAFVAASLFSTHRKAAAWMGGLAGATVLTVYSVPPFRQIIPYVYPLLVYSFPGRLFMIAMLGGSVAAGLGADWLIRTRPIHALRRISTACVAVAALLVALAIWHLSGIITTQGPPVLLAFRASSLLAGAGWLALTAGWAWAWATGRLGRRLAAGSALALVAVDLLAAHLNYNSAFPPTFAFPQTASLQFLESLPRQTTQPHRIAPVPTGLILPSMTPELYRLPAVSFYGSWLPARYEAYIDLTLHRDPIVRRVFAFFDDCCDPLLNALNVKYVYASGDSAPSSASGTLDLITHFDDAEAQAELAGGVQVTFWTINGMGQQVLFQHPRSTISFRLPLRQAATLETAIGIDPAAWDDGGDGVQFQVCITPLDTASETCPFSRYIDPKHNEADQTWIPVSVDLSQYAGQEITLTLKTEPGPQSDLSFDWAGWAEPRLMNYTPQTLKLIYDGPNKVYENKAALPRAWVVHQVTEVPADDTLAVAARLSALEFDPALEAVIEGALPGEMGQAQAGDSVTIVSYEAERVEIEADLKEAGLLVLSDLYYPGWRATVDGQAQPIYATNLAMRGVYLEGGRRRVVFEYRPPLFTIGLALSAATIALSLAGLIWTGRAARRRQG